MRKLRVSTLVTLDGVIQDPGGFGETRQGGWASPYFTEEAGQEAYAQLMNSDYFLCGRITYELLSNKWGNIDTGPYMSRMKGIPKLVASHTLKQPLTWNAKLIKGDAVEEIEKLKQESGKDILMYGSASLVRALTRRRLVDEYVLAVHPIVLGAGKRLFAEGNETAKLRLISTRTREPGVVILTYAPAA
jgi:dihydrofolate reductase